ncbi:MAG: CBS domain-containing protein [Candidatus Micrarchaeia archaeon]
MDLTEAKVFDASEPLSKAIDEILRSGTAVFVMKGGRFFGLIDDRNMSMGIADPSRAKCEGASVKSPTVQTGASVQERMDAFLSGHFKALPVVDPKGKIVGSTSRSDLLRELCSLKLVPRVQVYQFMSKPAYTIRHDQTVADAKTIMKKTGVHRLVVTSGENAVGVISTFDFAGLFSKPRERKGYQVISQITSSESKKIDDILRERFSSVPETFTLDEAAEKMASEGVSSLVILDGMKPTGLISATDVFKVVRRLFENEKDVMVSGLDPEHLVYYGRIKEGVLGSVKKFEKSFNIDNLAVHFKKGKTMYEATVHMDLNGRHVAFKCEAHELGEAVAMISKELKIIFEKAKSEKMQLKKRERDIE